MPELPVWWTSTEDFPYLTADLAGIGGRLKVQPGDFNVEEIPAYEPSGEGEHLYLWIEKTDVAADQLSRHLCKTLGIKPIELGVAAIKDKRATTRQWVSVPATCADKIDQLNTENIRVIRSALHGNKLKTGHLNGNRFSILVRFDEPADQLEEKYQQALLIADRIQYSGVPNYFGNQRYGKDGETARGGWELLTGEKKPSTIPIARRRFLLRLALSAAQSVLFNAILAERLTNGGLDRVEVGDVLEVVSTGGKFHCENAGADQARYRLQEVVPTGPMFGPRMRPTKGDVGLRETLWLDRAGLKAQDFTRFPNLTAGVRRPLVIFPKELTIEKEAGGLRFRFSLPSGSYATVVLREFLKVVEPISEETPVLET